MCCAMSTAAPNGAGSAPSTRASAFGPPVDAAITTTRVAAHSGGGADAAGTRSEAAVDALTLIQRREALPGRAEECLDLAEEQDAAGRERGMKALEERL